MVWSKKKTDAPAGGAPAAPVIEDTKPAPAVADTKKTTLEPVAPPPVAPPTPAVQPAAAGMPVKSVQAIVGTFVHKPNPFLSETLEVRADGSFTYKDSNGATASGKATFEEDVLVLTAGEVVRRFAASMEGARLQLKCAKDDAPTFKNDLASMSPTVLKVARYDKK